MPNPASPSSRFADDNHDLSPALLAYVEARAKYPDDVVLLLKIGDFYEVLFEDAEVAALTLGVALTSRRTSRRAIPMCGVPAHSLDDAIAKFRAAGKNTIVL